VPPAAARVGLDSGQRYRCNGCGNVTRFDVEVTERARRFWHADLSGGGQVDAEERETTVHAVSCRWCGSTDIAVETSPAAGNLATAAPEEETGSQ
jgi:hypothetical protein